MKTTIPAALMALILGAADVHAQPGQPAGQPPPEAAAAQKLDARLTTDYVSAVDHMLAGRPKAALAAYEKLLAAGEKLPAWIQLACHADVMAVRFALGDKAGALTALEKAVELGYSDFGALKDDPMFAPYRAEPRFRAAYEKIRTSPADQHELEWLKREVEMITAESGALLEANKTRKDFLYTKITPASAPDRQPQGQGVLVSRQILLLVQAMQVQAVLQSDHKRIFNADLRLYDNSPAAVRVAEELERKRAVERAKRVRDRAYKPPPNLSVELLPPPPL